MVGAGILPDDILIVDRTLDAANGSIVVAAVDGEFTVKYLRRDKNGVRLEPANEKFKPIVLEDGMELQLFGVVSGVGPATGAPERRKSEYTRWLIAIISTVPASAYLIIRFATFLSSSCRIMTGALLQGPTKLSRSM